MNIMHTNEPDLKIKFCLRCGRKLKTEQAQMTGMGKVCLEKSKVDTHKRLFEVIDAVDTTRES